MPSVCSCLRFSFKIAETKQQNEELHAQCYVKIWIRIFHQISSSPSSVIVYGGNTFILEQPFLIVYGDVTEVSVIYDKFVWQPTKTCQKLKQF